MKKHRFFTLTFALFFALCAALSLVTTAHANSAEPPTLTIIVQNPPDDLQLYMHFSDGNTAQLHRLDRTWDAHFMFTYGMVSGMRSPLGGATLEAVSSGKNFQLTVPNFAFATYNNLVTLNLDAETIAEGQPPSRPILLVTMRVSLTLIIEGLILLAFGYRKRSSWLIFLSVNLVTQTVLNILMSSPTTNAYWVFLYILIEIVVFLVECILFGILLKEHRRGRAVLYALTANAASLVLGGALITYLPI